MSSFRFVHTADLHLDSPFRGLAHIPSRLFQLVENSTFEAFEKIIEYCITENVDFLLIAGDIYDVEHASVKTQIKFYQSLIRLSEHNIFTYIIHGNHDPMNSSKLAFDWPETVKFFSSEQVEEIPFIKNNQEVARIFGRSYPTKAFKENIVSEYRPLLKQSSKSFYIGLLHTNVDGNSGHDPYAPSTTKELKDSEMDYWALGHIHKSQILSQNDPTIIYSGNPQGRHIKETGQKNCVLVEVSDLTVQNIKWLQTSSIIWETIEIDISYIENIESVIEVIQTNIDQLIAMKHAPVIVRIILNGKTKLNLRTNQTETIEDIQTALNDIYSLQIPWLWIESIILQTKPYIDIEKIMEQNIFISDLLNELEQFSSSNNADILLEIGRELFNSRGFKKHLSLLSDSELDDIYDNVRHLAINYLMEED